MNLKMIVTALVSIAVGLAVGFALFHDDLPPLPDPVTRAAEPVPTQRPAMVEPARQVAPVAPAHKAPSGAAPATQAQAPAPSLALPSATEPPPIVAQLEEKVQDLERQLSIERAIRRGTEGEAVPPPSNLAPRFRDEQLLLTTFNAALKAAGFPGQVSNIDCTEHPCLVFGTGFGERGDMEKLKGQLGPYEHDSFSTYGFGTGDGKKERRFFGVAVLPESKGPPDEALQKRITFRVNQMHEASKPPPK